MDGVAYYGPEVFEGKPTLEQVLDRLRNHKGWMALDTETVNTKDRRCIGIGLALGPREAIYFTAFQSEGKGACVEEHRRSPQLQVCLDVLMNEYDKVIWNSTFDLDVLEPIVGELTHWQDAAIVSRIQGLWNGLEDACKWLLGETHQVIADILPAKSTMLDVPWDKVAWKCMMDCIDTYRLYSMMEGPSWIERTNGFVWRDVYGKSYDVTPKILDAYRLDRALIPVIRRMGKKGLKLNRDRIYAHYERLAVEARRYKDICLQMYNFNPGSNQQLGLTLAYRGHVLPFTQTRGPRAYRQLKVDEDTLLSTNDPLAHIALNYRERADKLSDVVEPYLGRPRGAAGAKVPFKDWVFPGRVQSHWRIDLATSRLASYEDNLQNKTPELRDCYEADAGEFSWMDFSQIEMRIFAHLSGEPKLLRAYELGESVHLNTMHALFPGVTKYTCCGKDKCVCGMVVESPLYTDAKTFNFAVIYNAQATVLAKQTRRPVQQCDDLKGVWLAEYDVGHRFMLECFEHSVGHDWVETVEGRRIRLPPAEQQGEVHRATCDINYRVQGSAAWPVKRAILKCDSLEYDQRIQVHDEIVVDGVGLEFPEEFSGYIPGIPTPFETYHGKIWR